MLIPGTAGCRLLSLAIACRHSRSPVVVNNHARRLLLARLLTLNKKYNKQIFFFTININIIYFFHLTWIFTEKYFSYILLISNKWKNNKNNVSLKFLKLITLSVRKKLLVQFFGKIKNRRCKNFFFHQIQIFNLNREFTK